MSDTPLTDAVWEAEYPADQETDTRLESALGKHAAVLERQLNAANARIAELEKDKARLDWLDAAPKAHGEYAMNQWYGSGIDYRQAIDAAMRGTQP
jgi:hypothetical protein